MAPTTTCPEPSSDIGSKVYRLLAPDGREYSSHRPGVLGGHRLLRIYGRLDCVSAAKAISRGGYVAHRVFFASEDAALAAGYRPCGRCLREKYLAWKLTHMRGPSVESVPGDSDAV
jgi:hypothetical protein